MIVKITGREYTKEMRRRKVYHITSPNMHFKYKDKFYKCDSTGMAGAKEIMEFTKLSRKNETTQLTMWDE